MTGSEEIRSVIVPLTGGKLILPNANVAEVIAYEATDPVTGGPSWLLGTLLWRGWQVPLMSFPILTGQVEEEPTANSRICITKALNGNERMPYIGLLAQGFPSLVTITDANLTGVPMESKPIGVAGKAVVETAEVWVPDLDRLGHLVAHAAFGALPLTS